MMPRGLGRLVLDPWTLTPPLLDILQGLEHGAHALVHALDVLRAGRHLVVDSVLVIPRVRNILAGSIQVWGRYAMVPRA